MRISNVIEEGQDISRLLRSKRRALGVRQEDVASMYDLSRMTVIDAESGKGDPKLSTLLRLCDAVGMRLIAVPTSVADRITIPDGSEPETEERALDETDMGIDGMEPL